MTYQQSTPAERKRARALRQEGKRIAEIARITRRHPSTIQDWTTGIRPGLKQAKIAWDPLDKSWRILLRDIDREPELSSTKSWHRMLWLRFASYHAAEEHLELYGEQKYQVTA